MATQPAAAVLTPRVEAMSAEEVAPLLRRAVPRQGRARVLLPEGGDRAARHALRARAEGARLRDRHALPLPGDVRALARGRAALRHEGRGVRGPSAEELAASTGELWETKPDLYLAIAKVEPLVPRARSTSTAGSPASAATSRRRARTRRSSAGTRRTSCGRRTRSPTGATTTAGRTSASAGCPTTRCTTAATPRSATRTRRSRAPAARAAGPAPTAPSAACTSRRSS